jgi:hypothetical protein
LESHPDFAWQVSLLAIKYLLVDYRKVDEQDVVVSVRHLVQGAHNAGALKEAMARLRQVLALRKKAQKVPRIVKGELRRLGISYSGSTTTGGRTASSRSPQNPQLRIFTGLHDPLS